MKKLLVPIILFSFGFSLFLLYQTKLDSIPSISYFPLDEKSSFIEAQTKLELKKQNDEKRQRLAWNTSSKSDKSMYLRQDVSLLFKNGKLAGALSKWHENEDTIKLSERIYTKGTSLFQAISYHHGELHYPDGTIKSIQQMTDDELYVIENNSTGNYSFHKPKTNKDSKWKNQISVKTSKKLLYQWNKLINHYQINKEDYLIVPLTELKRFNTEHLPSLSLKQTNKIIGHLWEGLYKNYIVPITYQKEQVSSFVPVILFSKDNTHLLVLYEINGKKERLIQQYP